MANELEEEEVCSVCAEVVESDGHSLPCGHTFHTACIVEWFRNHHDTCPNCRSTWSRMSLCTVSGGKRIQSIRRQIQKDPRRVRPEVRASVQRYDLAQKRIAELRQSMRQLRREHQHAFVSYARMAGTLRTWSRKRNDLERHLGREVVIGVPLVHEMGYDSETL